MHHEGHSGGGCPKCVINTRKAAALARWLARWVTGASRLADAAEAAVKIHETLGMRPTSATQGPCEHATKLMAWIRDPKTADVELMDAWTAEILDDIEALIGGAVDPHHGEGG